LTFKMTDMMVWTPPRKTWTGGPPFTGCTGPDTSPAADCNLSWFAQWFPAVATVCMFVSVLAVHMVISTPWFARMYDANARQISIYIRKISKSFVSLVFVCMLTFGGNTYMPFITRAALWFIVLYVARYNKKAEGKLFLFFSMCLVPVVTSSIDYPEMIIYGRWVVIAITLVWMLIRCVQGGRINRQNADGVADLMDAFWDQLCKHAPLGKWVCAFMLMEYVATLVYYYTGAICWTDEIYPKWLILFGAIITYFLMFRENPFLLAFTIALATMIFHIPRLEGNYTLQAIAEPNAWTELSKQILLVDFFGSKPQWRIYCHDVTWLQAVNSDNPPLVAYTNGGRMEAIIKCKNQQTESIRTTYIVIVSVVFFLMQKIGAASDVEDPDLRSDSEDPDLRSDSEDPDPGDDAPRDRGGSLMRRPFSFY
jgi:hypothetical protein